MGCFIYIVDRMDAYSEVLLGGKFSVWVPTYEGGVDDPEKSRLDNDNCRSGGLPCAQLRCHMQEAHRHFPTSEERTHFIESHVMP